MTSNFEEWQAVQRPELLAGQISMLMRRSILTGDWKPGERIVESRLAKELGVGQPTIREALVALENVGLVTRLAVKGCIVTALTSTQARDLLFLRRELESILIGLICEVASDSELAALTAVTLHLETAAIAGNIDDFRKLDLELHQMTWKLSGNTFIPRMIEQVTLPLLAFFPIPGPSMLAVAKARLSMALHLEKRDVEQARKANRAMLERMEAMRVNGNE